MAAMMSVRGLGARLLKSSTGIAQQQANHSTVKTWSKGKKRVFASIGALAGGAGALVVALEMSIRASGTEVVPYKHTWKHSGPIQSLDHASIRRGYEVYKTVCAACHSLQYLSFRHLVNVCMSEEEVKTEAAEAMVKDGPDDTGAFFNRPGKLSDRFPSPYPNEEAARHANNGAYPPDLSLIVLARHGGEDYIFSLLTGYTEAPAGVILREGQYFNPYFPGGAISMAQAIYNETVDYADGTPASASQIAMDVATFLRYTSETYYDDRKKMFIKGLGIFSLLLVGTYCLKRHYWSALKTRKIVFSPKKR